MGSPVFGSPKKDTGLFTDDERSLAAKHKVRKAERPWEYEQEIRSDVDSELARRQGMLDQYLNQPGIQGNIQSQGLAMAERAGLQGRGGAQGNFGQRMAGMGQQGAMALGKAGEYGMQEAMDKRKMMMAENQAGMDYYLQAGDLLNQYYGGGSALGQRQNAMAAATADAALDRRTRQDAAVKASVGAGLGVAGSALSSYQGGGGRGGNTNTSSLTQESDIDW